MNGDPLDELDDACDEIKRLQSVIDRAAAAWMRCDGVEWEGDLADAVEAGVREIERLRAERNHWMKTAAAFDDHLATMRVMMMEHPTVRFGGCAT